MPRNLGVTETVRGHVPESFEILLQVLTVGGEWKLAIPILLLAYVADVFGTISKPEDKPNEPLCSKRTAVMIAAVLGGLVLAVLLKNFFALPRPDGELHAIAAGGTGFPSGHTMVATVFWGALAIWLPFSTLGRRVAIAAVIIAIVGLTRIGLGVHYLGDIIGAIVFGTIYLVVFFIVVDDKPRLGFAVALAVGLLAILVSGGGDRAITGFTGVAVGFVGWQLMETRPARRLLYEHVGPHVTARTRSIQERI